MGFRRQPSGKFLQRLKAYSEPAAKPMSRIRKYKDSDAWLWTEVAAVVTGLAFIIPTAIALWIDLEDRQTQRIAQAWALVTQPAAGNSGKGPALEYLKSQRVPLVGIDLSTESNHGQSHLLRVDLSEAFLLEANLSGAYLYQVNLSEAELGVANLSGADLYQANLSGASLYQADLSGAFLLEADLSGAFLLRADLSGADLSWADLREADLSGALLTNADLSGARLKEAKNLSQKTLDGACGDDKTQLPEGFTIKSCDEQ